MKPRPCGVATTPTSQFASWAAVISLPASPAMPVPSAFSALTSGDRPAAPGHVPDHVPSAQ
jgi:hypothetical protein